MSLALTSCFFDPFDMLYSISSKQVIPAPMEISHQETPRQQARNQENSGSKNFHSNGSRDDDDDDDHEDRLREEDQEQEYKDALRNKR